MDQQSQNTFYFQHFESGKYLYLSGDYPVLEDRPSDSMFKLQRSAISKHQEKWIHDKSLTTSTYNFRCVDSRRHLSFSGFWIKLYPANNTDDLTPWLVEQRESPGFNQNHRKLTKWLKTMDMEEYRDLFVRHGFDRMEIVLEMCDHHLLSIGIQKL